MASSNSSSTSSKTKKNAQDALDRFKMEVASEIGVNLRKATMVTLLPLRLVL